MLPSSYAPAKGHVKGELLGAVPAGGPDAQPFRNRLRGPAPTWMKVVRPLHGGSKQNCPSPHSKEQNRKPQLQSLARPLQFLVSY